jgi:CMP/dCMP kinase
MKESSFFSIAIDGPVAAGKGTVSRLVADRLGFLYVDTGAMYRVATYLMLKNNVDLADHQKVAKLVKETKIEIKRPTEDESDGRLATVLMDGEDVSWKIRTEDVGNVTPKVASIKEVREVLVEKQQEIAKDQNVVMEGRDITYRVLPHAQLKIYLTAGDFIRAHRRTLQLQNRGIDAIFGEVHADLIERDRLDMNREHDPLKIVPEAWVIDTSDMSIRQVVALIVAKVQAMMS